MATRSAEGAHLSRNTFGDEKLSATPLISMSETSMGQIPDADPFVVSIHCRSPV